MIGLAIAAAIAGALAAVFVFAPLKGMGVPRWAGPAAAGVLLLAAGAVYWIGGSPEQEGAPYVEAAAVRAAADPATLDVSGRIERLRDVVRETPGDGEAWAMLGRELARAERELEAISAFQRALSIDPQARTFSDLGQTIINLNEGEVTPDARSAFEAAMARDPDLPEAGFFLGLAAYQAGDRVEAADYWTAVLARLETDNPFHTIISRQAAELLSRPDVDAAAVDAAEADMEAAEVSPQERIDAMVERLEARVASGEGSLSDRLVLMRVRAMLGDMEGARAALDAAEADFGSDDGAQAILGVARQALGAETGDE